MTYKKVKPVGNGHSNPKCPECNSSSVIKRSIRYAKHDVKKEHPCQSYLCNNCGRRFQQGSMHIPVDTSFYIPKVRPVTSRRVVVLSDLHTGHVMGLTPPHHHIDSMPHMAEAYEWFKKEVERFKPYDICIINGDAIDGKASKNEGVEVVISDRIEQAKAAAELCMITSAKKYYVVSGTEYHTGAGEQFEQVIADQLLTDLYDELTLDVNGKLLNFRHKTGKSSVPYSTVNNTVKQGVWKTLNGQSYDLLGRAHIHEWNCFQQWSQDGFKYYITSPALQINSRYGRKQMSSYMHFGFYIIDVHDNGNIVVQPIIKNPEPQEIIKFGT